MQKRTREQVDALAMAMKTVLKQPKKNAQRDLIVERRGTSRGIALRHLTTPGSMSGLQGTTLEETVPTGMGVRGQTLKTIRPECACTSPHKLLS